MPQQSGLSTFITELKRRRVFRVAVVYGGVAFVIVQIIDGAFKVMGIKSDILTGVYLHSGLRKRDRIKLVECANHFRVFAHDDNYTDGITHE